MLFDAATLSAVSPNSASVEKTAMLRLSGKTAVMQMDPRGAWIGQGAPSVDITFEGLSMPVRIIPATEHWEDSVRVTATPGIKEVKVNLAIQSQGMPAGEMGLLTVDSIDFAFPDCR